MADKVFSSREGLPFCVAVGVKSATWGQVSPAGNSTQTLHVLGVKPGDAVFVEPRTTLGKMTLQAAWVSAANTISINLFNGTAGNITAGEVPWSYIVYRN